MDRKTVRGLKFFLIFFCFGLGLVLLVTSLSSPNRLVIQKNQEQSVAGSVSDVARQVSPSIVGISNLRSTGDMFNRSKSEATGSGVIYDHLGHIITNYHVVRNADHLIVTLADGNTKEASLVGSDPRTDLAVIKIAVEKKVTPARLGNSDRLAVGQQVVAIGNPLGLRFARSVTSGIVSGLNRVITTEEGFVLRLIQTDAAINPGNSGGALVNLNGEVIGINTIKIAMPGFEGMGFSIPSSQVKTIAAEIIKNGRVIRPLLGIKILGEINLQEARYYKLPVTNGVIIEPLKGGPAIKAGIKPNDIVSKINGKPVKTGLELQEKIFACRAGDKVTLDITRLPADKNSRIENLRCQIELVNS
ncbi:Peptidase S1C [Syntrophomonas zehnderi OL-4]|uniref:Peptidase S1C n=1 Tax=Syntrophomonas zehnderi OL-4 TaxID=690567 RepID=A0A0E4G8X5_9FIRM|nr:trypsin-like peptidase domain-containing protein [Syntrophomonas zehnderi]CFX00390.1 Peptidase S1C [Syntrophomonas zehnderi OL-4]